MTLISLKKQIVIVLFNSIMVLCSFIFTILIIEVVLRIKGNSYERFNQTDPILGGFHLPNARERIITPEYDVQIQTNKLGLRGRDYNFNKPSNIRRLIVLGDSFTEAFQVSEEESFVKQLESLYNGNHDNDSIQVLNFGMGGFGTTQEFLIYKTLGVKFHPNIVLLAFYVGNDFSDNYKPVGFSENRPYLHIDNDKFYISEPYKNTAFFRTKRFLKEYFYFFNFLEFKIRFNPLLSRLLTQMGIVRKTILPEKESSNYPEVFNVYKIDYNKDWDSAVQTTEILIKMLQKEITQNGSKLIVVMIPDIRQIDEKIWTETKEKYPAMKDVQWDLLKPNKILEKILFEQDIAHIDCYSVIKDAMIKGIRCYYNYDFHFNVNGHKLTAQYIYQYLIENNIL